METIVIEGLEKSFKKNKVLDGIDLTVKKGHILALLGPNGAGKTTTVKILSTLLKPDKGKVFVNRFDVTTIRSLVPQHQLVRRIYRFISGCGLCK